MRKNLTKLFLVAVVAILGLSLVSCKETKPTTGNNDGWTEPEITDEYKSYLKVDLDDVFNAVGDLSQFSNTDAEKIEKAYQNGVTALANADGDAASYQAFKDAKAAIIAAIPTYSGVASYSSLGNDERTKMLGALEAYAVSNGITGISLFENGGYGMYNERIVFGTETYIPGYGFGNLAEGSLSAPLANEANDAWKMYYHSSDASDPGTANYLNDKGSQVADYYGYFAGSYFTTFMNSTKDGYDWVPELADEKPTAVNPENGMATKWKFPVKTGSELKYSTNSEVASRAAYNNREVAVEDYITPYQILLTQANGYARGAEMATAKTGAIKGAAEYYNASKDGFNAEAWEKVGVKAYTDENGQAWFEYEFTVPQTDFYAMYYITSSLYQPVPQSFFDLVGKDAYCGYSSDKSTTPVDNSLALGAYVLEHWETDKAVVYSKNPNYVYADTKYKVAGVHISIIPGAANDPEAVFKEFLAGNVDACGIPQTKLAEYKNDPRTKSTTGDSNFKLNVNATDEATWDYLFGLNGVVSQISSEEDRWKVEPALSNPHFVKALSLSIDRVTFADKRGSIPSVDYLSSNYMSDPVNGISYATTEEHKAAVANLLRDTDGYGFSLDNAREYFKLALKELVLDGKYTEGTVENPTVIELQIAWMYPQHEEQYHKEIKQFLEYAFNHESVHGNKFKLDVTFWVGAEWDDVYYDKLMKGQYDLGFGSISGNALNPLDFLSVLSSNQNISGNFTLNWGTDTNDASTGVLVYDGYQWSFDALWTAANATAVVENGELVNIFDGATLVKETENADGTYTLEIEVTLKSGEGYYGQLDDLVLFGYSEADGSDYVEYSLLYAEDGETSTGKVVTEDKGNGVFKYTITITAEDYATCGSELTCGIDVYYSTYINEEMASASYYTVYALGPKAE